MEYISLNKDKDDYYDKLILDYHTTLISKDVPQTEILNTTIPPIVKSSDSNINYKRVKTIKNDFTENFNFNSQSEVIQSSLEYNSHLLKSIVENRNNLNSAEMALCMHTLWSNLKVLAHNADEQIQSHCSLSKSKKYCELYSESLKNKGKQKKSNKESGLVIVVNKSILEEYKE